MTPEQKQYYESELQRIRRGGYKHSAFVIDSIFGFGSPNLGPVDPPVVGFSQDDDSFYMQYLQNWDEIEALIAQLREVATQAWGPKGESNG